ncbi:TlyA family rRNA (cytidine-2'-O)-methyltransferase [Erysipelotrichaceae bacterium]|nr:TlyA family rRNA (cytidine-2'-O)-methyltransferase [Erysipelotrichaceae bacterium]
MRKRVDVILFEQGHFDSRENAKRAIMAGIVYEFRTQEQVLKPGTAMDDQIVFEIKGKKIPYVSRGGVKLKGAIDAFSIDLKDKIVLDIGSSTGGFTDCCLQEGAAFVYALDVGTNQLSWKMRSHELVAVMENTNFRYVEAERFNKGQPDIIVTDVSFISLKLIFNQIDVLFGMQAFEMIALIKPQFEAGRQFIGKNGIVRDPKVHQRVVADIKAYIELKGWHVIGIMDSPITGTKGNKEFLLYFKNEIGEG